MSDSIEFDIDEDNYTVEVTDFTPPGSYRWNEPPEYGEITLDDYVVVRSGSDLPYSKRPKQKITMTEFLKILSEDRGKTVTLGDLEDECFREVLERRESDFDDRDV